MSVQESRSYKDSCSSGETACVGGSTQNSEPTKNTASKISNFIKALPF